MTEWQGSTALIVIDVQTGFDDAEYWGPRNNPSCEPNVGLLIAGWRSHEWPIVYVRHDSKTPSSPLFPPSSGNRFKDVVSGEPDLLVVKSVHSAFYGEPNLDKWLKENDVSGVAICGIQTNQCCETTARTASDLGYEVLFVADATHTFDIVTDTKKVYRAREVSRYSELTIDDAFGRVVHTSDLVG